ncbi:MAG: hypothetical protein C0408_06415 [Odoribacter sp.]|nr:hypothetical protein [Odoribacter sp.]
MKTIFLLLMSFSILGLAACSNSRTTGRQLVYENTDKMVEAAETGLDSITPNDFKGMLDAMEYFYLLDVRSEDEFASGYIPSAVSIPRGVLEFRIADETVWDKEGLYAPTAKDMIIVYCKKGPRSILAAQTLKQLGFTNVRYLQDGWTKWNELYPEIQEKLKVENNPAGSLTSTTTSGKGC